MATNVASRDPPMTLARRLELQRTRIPFRLLAHKMLFLASLEEVWSKKQLVTFINGILSKFSPEFPEADSPTPGAWKLMRGGSDVDLSRWNPSTLDSETPIFICSDVQDYLPLITTTRATRGGAWTWARKTTSIMLPQGEIFLLQGDTHVLLSLRCQTRVKPPGKKKKTLESCHNVFVPVEYAVPDMLGLIRASSISGIYREPWQDNLLLDRRSISELGWTNGTILRLEIW